MGLPLGKFKGITQAPFPLNDPDEPIKARTAASSGAVAARV
jgi:hypothetical protein